MDITITPGKLCGTLRATPSKSLTHRYLICASFADEPTKIICPQTSDDIEATAGCLRALGADILRTPEGYLVRPTSSIPQIVTLDCKESGTTLRLLLPIVGALGVKANFILSGRLPQRPLSPLWEEMERMGCQLTRTSDCSIACTGQLHSGQFMIDGSVSSQFISGLLLAMSLMSNKSSLVVSGTVASKPYIEMTNQVMREFGIETTNNTVNGHFPLHTPGKITVEGDWSNSAFFLAANELDSHINITNLSDTSVQGDRNAKAYFSQLQNNSVIDLTNNPDLLPILAVVAAAKNGAAFTGISRLRFKESDRIASTMDMLERLGVSAEFKEDTLNVHPATIHGATINSYHDHRIAMAAAIAATCATEPVTILDAECVSKSYPSFWEEFRKLGGKYEQYIR